MIWHCKHCGYDNHNDGLTCMKCDKPVAPASCSACPVCKFQGEPECDETWNGVRGPGSRVIARQWSCPKCGVIFAHPDGWQNSTD